MAASCPWCARQGLLESSDLSTRLLQPYSAELLERGGARGRTLSKDTVWTYVKAVRGFFSSMKTEGDQVEADARLRKLGRRVIAVLERDEVQRLEDAAPVERDKLIVRLLADTGLRVGEWSSCASAT